MSDYNLQFVMQDKTENALSGRPYVIYDANGEIFQMGHLNDDGQTPVLNDEKEKYLNINGTLQAQKIVPLLILRKNSRLNKNAHIR